MKIVEYHKVNNMSILRDELNTSIIYKSGVNFMVMRVFNFFVVLAFVLQSGAYAVEIKGAGSKIPESLIQEWGKVYATRFPGTVIKYQASSPADGIKRLINKEVDFCSVDTPVSSDELKKNGLLQFPLVLGGISPVVNLPNVSPGQFRLDAKTLGDIFLGKIKKWDDPEIAALNPTIKLPQADIVVIHRDSPKGVSTIIGEYLAKSHAEWKALKGDTMAGTWPASSITVNNPIENFEMIQKTPFSIGYGPVSVASKDGLQYVKLKNKAGLYISPSDESISSAATNSKWDESKGYDVILTDQIGVSSWPLSMASFVLVRNSVQDAELRKEALKFFRYGLRFGMLNASQGGYIQLPDAVKSMVRSSLDKEIGSK